jgi:DNA replication protein DnaC
MLNHPTQDKLLALKLLGMAEAFEEQRRIPAHDAMTFEERLGLLVDRESTQRGNRELAQRLKRAHLRQSAIAEDIDFRQARGLDRALTMTLLDGQWIRRHDNCLITGSTGVGKSYLACALANQACRQGWKVLYSRAPRLFSEMEIAKADGSYRRRLMALARIDLLVLDDWGLAPLTPEQARDLLEILDDRYDRKSTLVAAQTPVENWHALIGDPALADATLDRLVHNAHRISLTGESMRKTRANLTKEDSITK